MDLQPLILKKQYCKKNAIEHSRQSYILADESKFGEVSFVKVADLEMSDIITYGQIENYERYSEKTNIKVVMDS